MSKKLLENGFNVICEKPLTTNLEEAKELYSLQKKNNLIFAVHILTLDIQWLDI